jgi:hypothetical protein
MNDKLRIMILLALTFIEPALADDVVRKTGARIPFADERGVPQLAAIGTRLIIANDRVETLSIYDVTGAGSSRPLLVHSFRLNPSLPYALSADGKLLLASGKTGTDKAVELSLFDVSTGTRTGNLKLSVGDEPDAVWVNLKGTAIGVFARNHFSAYDVREGISVPTPVFQRSAASFLASASGRFLLLTDDSGRLSILDSVTWQESTKAQEAIQRTVQQWLQDKGFRTVQLATGGPFVFPIVPIETSSDDRLVSVFLGENANSFLNVCMSSGAIVSSVMLDKRVTAVAKFNATGNTFAVQVSPNSDDPSFRRPLTDYGLRLFESYSSKHLATIPISSRDWDRFRKLGSKYFMDEWHGWFGFLADNKTLLTIDSASGKVSAQLLTNVLNGLKQPALAHNICKPVGS